MLYKPIILLLQPINYVISAIIIGAFMWSKIKYLERFHVRERFRLIGQAIRNKLANHNIEYAYVQSNILYNLLVLLDVNAGLIEGLINSKSIIIKQTTDITTETNICNDIIAHDSQPNDQHNDDQITMQPNNKPSDLQPDAQHDNQHNELCEKQSYDQHNKQHNEPCEKQPDERQNDDLINELCDRQHDDINLLDPREFDNTRFPPSSTHIAPEIDNTDKQSDNGYDDSDDNTDHEVGDLTCGESLIDYKPAKVIKISNGFMKQSDRTGFTINKVNKVARDGRQTNTIIIKRNN